MSEGNGERPAGVDSNPVAAGRLPTLYCEGCGADNPLPMVVELRRVAPRGWIERTGTVVGPEEIQRPSMLCERCRRRLELVARLPQELLEALADHAELLVAILRSAATQLREETLSGGKGAPGPGRPRR